MLFFINEGVIRSKRGGSTAAIDAGLFRQGDAGYRYNSFNIEAAMECGSMATADAGVPASAGSGLPGSMWLLRQAFKPAQAGTPGHFISELFFKLQSVLLMIYHVFELKFKTQH